jgi:tRNA nucleotidyltransferase/poly(A) polymerase
LQRSFIVGGSVRDWLLGMPVKDYDIEVFGVSCEQLGSALGSRGWVNLVGRSFGVIKFTVASGHVFDFSIPRRDSKVAMGHKGFAVEFDPAITPRGAAARRDFTLNTLMFDPRRREILDQQFSPSSLLEPLGPVWQVACFPDGKYVATGSLDNTARIWNSATGVTEQTG